MSLDRKQSLARLEDGEPFDIAIVGGGATGLGIAVDAASRGHRVALVEQSDFAKATSSRSTKLVHGGVRYLKQGNISLVLEALKERELLCRNAPHLAHHIPFVIPTYRWWEGPFYGVGMKVYDAMAGRLGLHPSRTLNIEQTVERIPTIEREHLLGGVEYHDGQFDDARLAIHLAMTAADHGAVLLNYTHCSRLIKHNGICRGIVAEDLESGDDFTINAAVVINATGVFADTLRTKDEEDAEPMIAASQGVHMVLPRRFLPGESAIMIPKTDDGRVLFAVPWHDCVVLGTTDTPIPEASLEPRPLEQEIEFLFEHAAKYLQIDPTPDDVLSIFAGIRPLVSARPGSKTSALARDHTILVSPSGLLTITGGKWTTYRRMAEDAVNQAESVGALEEKQCVTGRLPIHGSGPLPNRPWHEQVYGTDMDAIEALEDYDETLWRRIHPAHPFVFAEVAWHISHEMARTVEDVLARRLRLLLLDARAAIECAESVARFMASRLGYREDWIIKQTESFHTLAAGYLLKSR